MFRRFRHYQFGGIAILLFIGVMLIPWTGTTPTYPVFDTADWVNTQMPGRLLIRSGMDGEILLTMRDELEKGVKHRAVYEYDPKAKRLPKVPDAKWEASVIPISECVSQPQKIPGDFKVTEVPVKGSVLVSSAYSPSVNVLAILSADGPRKGSIMPFIGGGQNSKGQHYHQLFSVANGTPVGDAVKLPFTTEKEAYPACWSLDEKFVFYTSLLADKLTIVETGFHPDKD